MTEQEKIKRLTEPRFKLIADYPGNTREVGSISVEVATASYFRKYKANFMELKWYIDRSKEEMPDYLKLTFDGSIVKPEEYGALDSAHLAHYSTGEIEKRGKWKGTKVLYHLSVTVPATEQEYLDYVAAQKGQ